MEIKSSKILFTDAVEMWLEEIEKRVSIITFESYERVAKNYVIPYFIEKENCFYIDEVTYLDIQRFVDYYSLGKERPPLSGKSIRHLMNVVRGTIVFACRNGYATDNPCSLVIMPKMTKRDPTILTERQLNEFFELIQDDPMFPLIYVTAFYGLRRSEVLGLKWDSIDFNNKTISIKHTVIKSDKKGFVEQDTTKTASSRREYPLTPAIESMFINLRNLEDSNRKKFNKLYQENDYVFKWDYGKMYSPDHVTRHFKRLLKNAGMPDIRFHDLRHSCASMLVSKGFKLKDIQEWLGHADIQTTANIYAHLYKERKDKIAQSIGLDNSLLEQANCNLIEISR
ncbi:MAG: site-specific integrase [Clostridia bacterium]|nr:site-specific integrase [Clostridia bacterium]